MNKCHNKICNHYLSTEDNNCSFTTDVRYCAYNKKEEPKELNSLLIQLTEMICDIEVYESLNLSILKEDLFKLCKEISKEYLKENIINE